MNLFIIIIISVTWGMKGRQAGRQDYVGCGKMEYFPGLYVSISPGWTGDQRSPCWRSTCVARCNESTWCCYRNKIPPQCHGNRLQCVRCTVCSHWHSELRKRAARGGESWGRLYTDLFLNQLAESSNKWGSLWTEMMTGVVHLCWNNCRTPGMSSNFGVPSVVFYVIYYLLS